MTNDTHQLDAPEQPMFRGLAFVLALFGTLLTMVLLALSIYVGKLHSLIYSEPNIGFLMGSTCASWLITYAFGWPTKAELKKSLLIFAGGLLAILTCLFLITMVL